VLAAIDNRRWALLFLFVFSAGTIAGMMLITLAIALPFVYSSHRPHLAGGLRLASGLLSAGFGCLLTYQIGASRDCSHVARSGDSAPRPRELPHTFGQGAPHQLRPVRNS
jgi:hypothetical protein